MSKKHLLGLTAAMLILAVSGCAVEVGTEVETEVGGTSGEQLEAAVTQNRPEKIEGIIVDKNTAVVIDTVVDIFTEPDIRSERLTQVLYNQPVSITQEKSGWTKVKTSDGSEGWIRSKYLDRDISSIYGKSCICRIAVTSRDKAVYSQAKGGVTVKDTVMGTVFYTFNSSDEAYEVYLPGNTTGWLRGSGIIQIGIEESIPKTSAGDFAATALKFKGAGYLWKGISGRGIDSCGLLYLCAKINGITFPRQPEKQQDSGSNVAVGSPSDIAGLKSGDLLFFMTDTDSGKASYAGIYLGEGKYIYSSKASGYVKVDNIDKKSPEGILTSARRLFDN